MFFKAKPSVNKNIKMQTPQQVGKYSSQPDKETLTAPDDIEETLLNEVGGGLNPQPLPPGNVLYRLSRPDYYICETEKS